ncbi:MAG: hypothetical protein LBQ66_16950, partial [Planctomycetaceae bacterium]|nr:hypothetical protein [Planctomycetaceae bacterium]
MSRQIAFVVVGILVVSLFGGCGMRTIPATDTNTRQTDNNDSPQITDTSINTDIFRPASPAAGAGGFDLPPIQPDHSSLMPPNTLQELGNTSTNLIGNTGSLPVTDINPNINDP